MGQEGQQVLVGRPVCPGRVDGIAVHGEEVARGGGFGGAQPAVFLQVLHVQSDGHPGRGVGGPDGRRRALQPVAGGRAVRRAHAVGVLVAQVPRPQRWVACQGGGGLAGQPRLRFAHRGVRVPVAQRLPAELPAGEHPEARVAVCAAQRPVGNQVHPAHVTGEERGHDGHPRPLRQVRDHHEPIEHGRVHPVWRRLEDVPGQEEPDRIEAPCRPSAPGPWPSPPRRSPATSPWPCETASS